jgi:CRP-like cAMP-binding protein
MLATEPESILNHCGNRILGGLEPEEYELVVPHLRKVSLESGRVLYMPDQKIEHIYFPISGLISLLATLEGGASVEAGVVGNEGVVGISAVLGVDLASSEALVQVAGESFQMKAAALWPIIRNGGPFHDILLRYTHTIFTQVAQTAACNRAHSLNERLARWLLLTHDRVGSDRFEMTHEFLARMLGTRRAGVSVAASALRDAGAIDYTRGSVTIVDRLGLENASCECYRVVKSEFDRVFK